MMLKRAIGVCALIVFVSLPAVAQDQKLVATGKELATKNHCSMCHVIGGTGGKIGKSLDGVGTRLDAAALRRILLDPQKEFPNAKVKMPKIAWAQSDLDALIAYLQSLK